MVQVLDFHIHEAAALVVEEAAEDRIAVELRVAMPDVPTASIDQ